MVQHGLDGEADWGPGEMNHKQKILLSADGEIYLYEAIPEIAADLDACDEAF